MTMSELHAVMTGGFATIAGSVLGAYISFGVSYTESPSRTKSSKMTCAPSENADQPGQLLSLIRVWASAQSNQSLCCPHKEALGL